MKSLPTSSATGAFAIWNLQLFYRYFLVGIDADITGYLHGFLNNRSGVKLRMIQQGPGRSQRIGAAGPDGGNAVLRFDHIPVARRE